MSYEYEAMRPKIFTDEGQRMFLKVQKTVEKLLKLAGVFEADAAWADVTGDTWMMLACLDRLVELCEIKDVETVKPRWGQHRIFEAYTRG